MTVIRSQSASWKGSPEFIAAIAADALSVSARYVRVTRVGNGINAKFKPEMWPIITSTKIHVEVEQQDDEWSHVTITTTSQPWVTGDRPNHYLIIIGLTFSTIQQYWAAKFSHNTGTASA